MTQPNAHRKRNILVLVSIVIFLMLGFAPPVAEAIDDNTYYVATNGNDSSPGTLSEPWRTIQHAVESVTAGDTIIVREGTYNEGLDFSVSGQEGAPIVLTTHQDELVTIDGGAYPALLDKESTQYWIIDGFTLDSDAGLTIELGGWDWCETRYWVIRDNYIIGSIGLYGSYNTIEGNEIDGSQHKGSEFGIREWTEVSHHNLYKNNHIHHFYNRGIWSMYFTHDSIFEGNHIHDIGNQGLDLDGFSTVVWRHTVRNNYIHDCGRNGIALENAFETVVENNVVHDISSVGISTINYGGEIAGDEDIENKCRAGGENDQYGDTDGNNDCRGNITGNIIRQNLVYNIRGVGGICVFYAGGVSILGNTISISAPSEVTGIIIIDEQYAPEIRMQGNIISGYNTCPVSVRSTDSLIQDSHNLIYQIVGLCAYYTGGNTYSLSEYQAMTGKGQGSIAADARFVDPAGNDFHLSWDSPAIDSGIAIGLSTDLDGWSRPQGLDYDMGVYEYTGGAQAISIPLHSGWNLVSVPVHPSDTSTAAVLSTIAGNYDLVYAYDASDTSAPWKSLDPSVPSFANDLVTIDETKGLWLLSTGEATWTVPDYTLPAGITPLYPGWNLVGYPSLDPLPIADALASIEGKYTLVYTHDPSDPANPWKTFDPTAPPWSNELTQMLPGRGYWILVTQPCEWSLSGQGDPVSSHYPSHKVEVAAPGHQVNSAKVSARILEPPSVP